MRGRWRARVRRTGGGALPQSETFFDKGSALTFKLEVEACEHDWPDNYVKGVGWVHEQQQEPVESPVPFGDYALAFVRGLSGVAARTRHDYERDLRNHLLPAFGHLDIRDGTAITPALVRQWVNGLQTGERNPLDTARRRHIPLRPKTIQNLHGLLMAILQDAVETNPPLRSSNPAAGIRLPRLDDGTVDDEMVVLTHDEFRLLRDCIKPDARDMLTTFVGAGMRYAELTALQVRDLHLTGTPPVLRVRRAWKRQPDSTFSLDAPKTRRSRRTITLSAEVATALEAHAAHRTPEDFVFTTRNDRWWRHGAFHGRRWLPALQEAHAQGLAKRPRIHDLRHTHVAWLIAGRVALPAIQRRLGVGRDKFGEPPLVLRHIAMGQNVSRVLVPRTTEEDVSVSDDAEPFVR